MRGFATWPATNSALGLGKEIGRRPRSDAHSGPGGAP